MAGSAPSVALVKLREQLSSSGVTLVDTPQVSNHKISDKFMIPSDLMTLVLDYPAPARIVLISDDVGLAYHLSTLHGRDYQVILIVPGCLDTSLSALRYSADVVFQLRGDVLPQKPKSNLPGPKIQVKEPISHEDARMAHSKILASGPGIHQPSANNREGSIEYFAPLIRTLMVLDPDSTLASRGIQMKNASKTRQLRVNVASAIRIHYGIGVFGHRGWDAYVKQGWSDYAVEAQNLAMIRLGSSPTIRGADWVELVDDNPMVISHPKTSSSKGGNQRSGIDPYR